MSRTCFVTVGTTVFDDLITTVLSEKCRKSLKKVGIDKLLIQCGSGSSISNFLPEGLKNEDAGCFVGEDGLKVWFHISTDYKERIFRSSFSVTRNPFKKI